MNIYKNKYIYIIIGFIFGSLLFVAVIFITKISYSAENIKSNPTAIINIIEAKIVEPIPYITITPDNKMDEVDGAISIGTIVKITGTEYAGLRLRNEPNINGQILSIAMEDEIFEVLDGPISSDDYYWWYLRAPYDKSRNGWAVSKYLSVIEEK